MIGKYVVYFVMCDNPDCELTSDGGDLFFPETKRKLIKIAKEEGWVFQDYNKKCYCPECAKKMGLK